MYENLIISTLPCLEIWENMENKDKVAMKHSLDAIFRPKSVAVIGASTQKGSLGREIFDKLLNFDFNGPVFPVNPKARYIHSVKAYPSISAIPEQVDLAVVVVRKEFVPAVVQECADAHVKGMVVITAGFKETGAKGKAAEEIIKQIAIDNNMRLVGPNCMGIINTEKSVRLDATFAETISKRGRIAMASQSGALGQTILEHAHELNLGISMFVSLGNKVDISGNDLLEYWQDDENIGVILMYLESFIDPERFYELARKVSRKKPIIVVKSGRTTSGARAATSHTGAMAGQDLVFNTLFRQCGIIRANTMNEMFDFAMAFANVPLPKGNRVAIITNAGGPGIMAADACENHGLEVASLADETKSQLKSGLAADASVENPVDLLAGAQPDEFKFALQHMLNDAKIDAVIVIFVAPIITDPMQVAKSISAVIQGYDKPVLGCFMGVKGVATGVEELHRQQIPAYSFPESAARALGVMTDYSNWLHKDPGRISQKFFPKERIEEIIRNAVSENRQNLTEIEIAEILKIYEIPFVQSKKCRDWDEIQQAAQTMRFPLVLKISSDVSLHKSELGGVKLNLQSTHELKNAYAEILDSIQKFGRGKGELSFVVQEMVSGGKEIIMGINRIPGFGSLLMFGMGGIYVEVLQDVAFRIAPITETDAEEMIKEIKGYSILSGIRGEKPVATDFLKTILLNLSKLAQDFPQIFEMDMNPFMAFPDQSECKAVDVRIKVSAV